MSHLDHTACICLTAIQRVDATPGLTKAAFNALAVSAEGCSEYIRTKKYLQSFLQVCSITVDKVQFAMLTINIIQPHAFHNWQFQ